MSRVVPVLVPSSVPYDSVLCLVSPWCGSFGVELLLDEASSVYCGGPILLACQLLHPLTSTMGAAIVFQGGCEVPDSVPCSSPVVLCPDK